MTSVDPKLAMPLTEALAVLTSVSHRPSRPHTLHVKVFSPGNVGGTACVAATSIFAGIDWDDGKLIIETSKPLTTLTPDDVEAIHKSAKAGQTWHAYQQHKQQADTLQARDTEIATLKAQVTELQKKLSTPSAELQRLRKMLVHFETSNGKSI